MNPHDPDPLIVLEDPAVSRYDIVWALKAGAFIGLIYGLLIVAQHG